MPVRITMAEKPEQIDEVFKLRHRVFSEEEGKFSPTPDKRVLDRFDAYPTTRNLILVDKEQIMGSLRLTLDSAMGTPADASFDFRAHLPMNCHVMSCGMYCVTKPFRGNHISIGMLLVAGYFAISNGVTHIIAPINPVIARLLESIGFKMLSEEITDPHSGLTIIPILLDMQELNDFFVRYAQKNQIQGFIGVYECAFYQAGEYIIKSGEIGNSAFVLVEGQAEVKLSNQDKVIAHLGEGEVFGELALLTDDVRTADVIAKTDLRVMTLSKHVFMEQLVNNPEKIVNFLKTMGTRMKALIESSIR